MHCTGVSTKLIYICSPPQSKHTTAQQQTAQSKKTHRTHYAKYKATLNSTSQTPTTSTRNKQCKHVKPKARLFEKTMRSNPDSAATELSSLQQILQPGSESTDWTAVLHIIRQDIPLSCDFHRESWLSKCRATKWYGTILYRGYSGGSNRTFWVSVHKVT